MRLALIDNYDSFTWNLYHYFEPLVKNVDVFRNDAVELDLLKNYSGIVFSPGPGLPSHSPIMNNIVRRYEKEIPILGICLGHQAIGEAYGAKLKNLNNVLHGISLETTIIDKDELLFRGLNTKIKTGHYHSWVISKENFPNCLKVTSVCENGEIMSLSHREFNVKGIQFHPESIMTEEGRSIIKNWLKF